MNIFVTSPCPKECAEALDDQRLVKMVLETAQILSVALRKLGVEDDDLYKMTHEHHRCCNWACATSGNYFWLLEHLHHLGEEYFHRYGRIHLSVVKLEDRLFEYANLVEEKVPGARGPFTNATLFKHIPDIHAAYQQHLLAKWRKSRPRFTRRQPPRFLTEAGVPHDIVQPLR